MTVHALDHVSVEVAAGEMLAVLGRNGAGKSTLLRIVAGVYKPDSGRVETRGRLSSLVELGAGFHPELSGRENVEVAGLISGLSRREVRERSPAIFAFAEIEAAFLDAPVRTYSSGMLVRLGFAVAAEVEPAVLLVDEALAVGDLAFQRKCLDRIATLKARGTAILVVSHDLATVEALADRALVLDGGRRTDLGPAREIVPRFRAALVPPS